MYLNQREYIIDMFTSEVEHIIVSKVSKEALWLSCDEGTWCFE